MTHENAEDLTANIFVGRSVRHRSTIGFARHRSYGRTATVDKIAQPMGNVGFGSGSGCRSLMAIKGRENIVDWAVSCWWPREIEMIFSFDLRI
jgi:hypothetical protein